MTSGAMITVHDFMNFELGKICGWKFEDLNSNGVWDEEEPALKGWPIHMIRNSKAGETTIYTDEEGRFCFTGLVADWYYVWEELLPGWTATTQTWGEATITSGAMIELDPFGNFENVSIEIFKYEDVNGNGVYDEGDHPIQGWMFTVEGPCFPQPLVVYTNETGKITVWITEAGDYMITEEDRDGWMHVNPESGSAELYVESGYVFKQFRFGNFELVTITGQKFYDWNLNGIKDEAEQGLANWVIWINGTLVSGGWLNITRLTDSNGYFSVTGLPAGTYVVSERFEYAPAGWVPTTATSVVVTATSGVTETTSFGNAVFGVIKGLKFYDKDMDGVPDEGEPGLAGWEIILEGYTDQGVYVYRTTTTDANGLYYFDDVQPGVYDVTEVLSSAEWMNTTPLPQVVDVSGSMVYFEYLVEIGNVRFAKIHGYKFIDTYSDCWPFWPNGVFDEDEYGRGDWEITLQGWTTTGVWVDRVEYTDNMVDIGYYEFDKVLPGTYWVNETLLWGYYATRPIANLVMVYPFPYGPVNIVIDFGNLIPNIDPEVNFVLEPGWNLWSTPIIVDELTAKGLLEIIGETALMVAKFDTKAGEYIVYVVDYKDVYDFPVLMGEGYYIWVSSKTSFVLKGTFESPSVRELDAAWNLVGYNSVRPAMASDLLQMVDGCTAIMVVYLDAETGRYEAYVVGDNLRYDFQMTPGRAYYIWVDGPGQIVYPEL
jgi:hypothetical protein